MAERSIFYTVGTLDSLIHEEIVSFPWSYGNSISQKQKNISALHNAAKARGIYPLLEVSTKSDSKIGRHLSAFNLKVNTKFGEMSLESVFQGSKVFENGGPFNDIYKLKPWLAKKDKRLQSSGKIIGFDFFGQKWPLVPKTVFYDWLYLSVLHPHQEYLKKHILSFKGFTDIEFNPKKSINCQARTCALLVSLIEKNELDNALKSQENFIEIVFSYSSKQSYSSMFKQEFLL